jgi:hypothetical protein
MARFAERQCHKFELRLGAVEKATSICGTIHLAANPLKGLNYVDQLNQKKVSDWAHGELAVGWIEAGGSVVCGGQFDKR